MTSVTDKHEEDISKSKKLPKSLDMTQNYDNYQKSNGTVIKTSDLLNKIEQNARNEDSRIRYNNNNNNNNADFPNLNLNPNNDPNMLSLYNYYRLNANTIPPYVIDRLAHVTKNNDVSYNNNLSDPFTETFIDENNNVKWGDFLKTIKIANSNIPVQTSLNCDNKKYENGNPQAFIDDAKLDVNDFNMSMNMNNNNNNSSNTTNTNISPYLVYDGNQNNDNLTIEDQEKIRKAKDEALMKSIFKNYDLWSNWKGENRLRGLFESPHDMNPDLHENDTTSDLDICDEEDQTSSDYNYNRHHRGDNSDDDDNNDNDNDTDLEMGYKNRRMRLKRKFNLRRLRRERDLRERAKYWIDENKKTWKPKLLESIRTNSYFPLFFRLISISLSSIALGLSARIVKMTQKYDITQQPSPLMAMIVQAVSILYLFYITYDEFTSQPLGLRNPRAKIRLIMLDLIFIIFSSANLSLSFESIYDSRWVCTIDINDSDSLFDSGMCVKVKALTAFLFLTLTIWCINFSISVFRVVHVVSYHEKN